MLTSVSQPRPATLASVLGLLTFLSVGGGAELLAQSDDASTEWQYYGGNLAFNRYAPLDQIDRTNVADIEVVWRRPGVDPSYLEAFPDLNPSAYLRATPVLVDGVLYAPNSFGLVEAFDPGTGRTLWVQEPFEPTIEEVRGRSNRGVQLWGEGGDRRIILVREPYLYALDPATGRLLSDFGEGGRVLLSPGGSERFRWSFSPIVVGEVIVVAGIIGSAGDSGEVKEALPEDVRGFDVRTGRHLWTFHILPRQGEFGHDTWGDGSSEWAGDMGSWCCLSADEETGIVYVPSSAPTAAYYGGHRPGSNLFSNSLIALNAETGERLWHFQMVHHDLWEYDTVGPPVLGDIVVEGRTIRAVMQPSKTGFLYVFDRDTGEPVWPIEERSVPQSTVPGERSSPTQPFPTKPPPFGAQGATEDDLIDFTPELRAKARELVKPFRLGPIFTPPSMPTPGPSGELGTLTRPGIWGSGNWHSGAFDPETGYYYAVSHQLPDIHTINSATGPDATMMYAGRSNLESAVPTIDGLPIFKPPYGRITAIDMSRGEHAWMVPNGDGPRDHPLLAGLDVGPLGISGRAAPLVTKRLLFIGEGSDAVIGTTGSGLNFRAYDKATGEVVWTKELEAGTTGAPMTYMHDGTQYIVVAIGGNDREAEWVALALR
ncbi:MAG: PQQ-binding-like beta-propeller repeat protein [Gemmatimonadetes bacterium]|nr:PQQ-binding-like beta-propeller repeat protein [Gemmatimonadota bacterium]